MITESQEESIAQRLIEAYDRAEMLPPITLRTPEFDVAAAYRVLARIESRRVAQGWTPVGRKIGATNPRIWASYGLFQPLWAHIWAHTVHHARDDAVEISLSRLVQPRLEPEVVFGLGAPVPATDDPREVMQSVVWIAAGFEVVQSHFPDWKFAAADCTAAFGLHGGLAVGRPVALTSENRDAIAELLPRFNLSLYRGDEVIDRGRGSDVLGGPAHALAHLARVIAQQPQAASLERGEIVTTGTITDAWPVEPGETWHSDYGELPLSGLRVMFT